MRIHERELTAGITRTLEFEKKRLAEWAANCGIKRGHNCMYCSTSAMLRMHPAFKEKGENPFGIGYAIVDPSTPDRLARDARRRRKRGMVQLCTTVDAWAPEAQRYQLGRQCLEAILSEPGWTVRILTKNAAVRDDFGFIERHRDRVLVGLSVTATPDTSNIMSILEPNASSIRDRMSALREAAACGLRTYAMFCPLLLGIADTSDQIDRMVRFAVECDAEEIFVEPVNPRGPGLRMCQEALKENGRRVEAAAIGRIRKREHWSRYVADLVTNVQQSVRRLCDITKLRFLLYPSNLSPRDRRRIQGNDEGVIWLGRDS